ncbi:MAG: YigZ family protein [Candidatus Dadabacteria bacterium]|nr:YigZ family protein [Candidatus Dadabacteria bacterium]
MEDVSYQVPAGVSTAQRIIKKSRFIATVSRAGTRREAEDFIESVRALHPAASHNCYAFLACAPGGADIGFGDDGEVSGTAGRPMMTLLEHSGIGEIVVVVTRYFGGIKLGPGGLLRAYTDSLRAALGELELKEHVPVRAGHIVFSYAHENSIRVLFEKSGVTITSVERGEDVRFGFTAPLGVVASLEERVASLTRGKSKLVWT